MPETNEDGDADGEVPLYNLILTKQEAAFLAHAVITAAAAATHAGLGDIHEAALSVHHDEGLAVLAATDRFREMEVMVNNLKVKVRVIAREAIDAEEEDPEDPPDVEKIIVHSTNGDIVISKAGRPLEFIDVAEVEGGAVLREITQFDLAEYERKYGRTDEEYDILDLGYWSSNGGYVLPDQEFRKLQDDNAATKRHTGSY